MKYNSQRKCHVSTASKRRNTYEMRACTMSSDVLRNHFVQWTSLFLVENRQVSKTVDQRWGRFVKNSPGQFFQNCTCFPDFHTFLADISEHDKRKFFFCIYGTCVMYEQLAHKCSKRGETWGWPFFQCTTPDGSRGASRRITTPAASTDSRIRGVKLEIVPVRRFIQDSTTVTMTHKVGQALYELMVAALTILMGVECVMSKLKDCVLDCVPT